MHILFMLDYFLFYAKAHNKAFSILALIYVKLEFMSVKVNINKI
ncbi:hypothetical protein VAE122_2980553 [Vibrio aestuarianus]|nr:hypothetical protein VAE122_2980553 [Vibrio aestuarianus]